MKIVVVGVAPKSSDCWSKLFETLDGGVAEGVISYDMIDYFEAIDDIIKQYDGAIYLENTAITEDIPFMTLDNCDFTDEEFFEFIDTIHEYIEWKNKEAEPEPVEVVEKTKKTAKSSKDTSINMDDLAYEITENDIKKLTFKAITITVGGKEVRLEPREFIALSKMCKVMDRFGYKVKNVIV